MNQNRLFKKFLSIFLCLVLVPFMLLLLFLFWRANVLQLKNDIAHNENLTLQTINTVRQQTELAENMCKAVIQNQNFISFLDKEYETMPDLLYYRTTIRDFVKVTNGVSDIKLQIYLENDSIPLGFGIFYPMHYINPTTEFSNFYDSEAESIWLQDQPDTPITKNYLLNQGESYHYLRKIRVASHNLGVVEAVVPSSVYTIQEPISDTSMTPMAFEGCQIYNYSGRTLSDAELLRYTADAGTNHNKHLIYTFMDTENAPFDVLVVTSRSQIRSVHILLFLLIPALFAAMMTGFFLYNRRTIRDIDFCLDRMELAIQQNFASSADMDFLPTERILQRNDEISVLANRINYLLQQIRTLLAREIQQQTAAKDAQLLALQHQINPHFLYNTMEVFSARMELAGLYEESGAISAFCRMLRYNMNTMELMTTLADEIQQVKYYLAIQKIRNIAFQVDFDIPEELLHERTIRFLLEPFVENSFKYRGTASPLHIKITAQAVGDNIELAICNNGDTLTEERMQELNSRFASPNTSLKTSGEHIGLNNINSRLKLFYGDDHYIHVESHDGETCFRFLVEHRPPAPDSNLKLK